MAHPVGERLRCDECGAEIVFVAPCPCSDRKEKAHSNLCCGKEMHVLKGSKTVEPIHPHPN